MTLAEFCERIDIELEKATGRKRDAGISDDAFLRVMAQEEARRRAQHG